MSGQESDVLAAIEELEREERRPWFEAPERAYRRGARMEVAPPPCELQREVAGYGVFPDAQETRYDSSSFADRMPSFRSVAPPPEEDDVRRMREWFERVIRLSTKLQERIYLNADAVLLPREYPALEMVCGMPVHHLPIRGGYVGYRCDAVESGMAAAMITYWTLERAGGEPWIVVGRELLHRMARSEDRFYEPVRLSVRDLMSVPAPIMSRSFSELERMRVLDVPSVPSVGGIFVGFSMTLPLITDMERELRRQ